LTLLVGLLGVVLLVRRPRAVRPQRVNTPVRDTPPAAAPEASNEPDVATATASNSETAKSNSDGNKNGTSDIEDRQEPQETRPP